MKTVDDSQILAELLNTDLGGINTGNADVSYFLVEAEDIIPLIPARDGFTRKDNFGHALLIAGSRGKMGAAILSAKACLRAGAGLLTVHIPARGETIMQMAFPEAITEVDGNSDYVTELTSVVGYDAIAVGPGVGLQKQTAVVLYELLKYSNKPLIIDAAAAFNLLAEDKTSFRLIPAGSILTLNAKEFDRLMGDNTTNPYERLHKAIHLAEDLNIYLILKGAYTAVCTPGKHCYFNSTGNSGMETASSGDVLTGIMLGLLAQSYTPFDAAITGVFLHGHAGDIAASKYSEESLIASDIIDHLGIAFKF
ncbi:MAG: NAD(P)H-hydrate dehydratase [Dysgonamonadaceae bacterium]|jgi:NAD(P)H-hydrate epimerase|nr:NAD(P)H-hydrate dehydratase [Dysgonamonadaceae bacterium]